MRLGRGTSFVVAVWVAALCCGCATTSPMVKKEEPAKITVRLPVTEGSNFSLETVPSLRPPTYPLSFADEWRGRWLTLFEFEYYPPLRPPPPPEDVDRP